MNKAARAPEVSRPYDPRREDSLDPGYLIYQAVCREMARQLAARAGAAREAAFDHLLRLLGGAPLPARPARALIQFQGPPGSIVPAGTHLRSAAGDFYAVLPRRRGLAQVVCTWGLRRHGGEVDLTGSPTTEPLAAVRLELWLAEQTTESGMALPGLLWPLPAVLSRRFRTARVFADDGSAKLRWLLDPAGRVYLPPQTVRFFMPAAGRRVTVELELPLEAGEWSYAAGPILVNVEAVRAMPADDRPDAPPPAGTFVQACTTDGGVEAELNGITVAQPFVGWPGRAAEDPATWRRRATGRLRHRLRAVTRDDYLDLIRDRFPEARVLEVAPTRMRIGAAYRDAVRLTLVPRRWDAETDLLDQALLLARLIEQYLSDKTPLGVRVVAGPPCLARPGKPAPDDPLWPYRDWIVSDGSPSACRADGVYWPVWDAGRLREEG